MWGGGCQSSLKFPPGGLGGGVKISYIFFGGGGAGSLETPLGTSLVFTCIFTCM